MQSCEVVAVLGTDGTGTGREWRQREPHLQLAQHQAGKSKERKWSRNGLGLCTRGAATGRPAALPAARELQGFTGGPSQRVPPGGLSAGAGEGGGSLVVRHGAHGHVGALLPSNLKNSTGECARVGQGGCRADRDGAQPLLLHTLAAAVSIKASSEHSNREAHGRGGAFQHHHPSAAGATGSGIAGSSGQRLPQGEATTLPLPAALRAHGSPASASPLTCSASSVAALNRQSPSRNQPQARTSTAEQGRREAPSLT